MLHNSVTKKYWVQFLNAYGNWQFHKTYSSYEKARDAALKLYEEWYSVRLVILNSNEEYEYEEFIR